jgi:hypothetical protein
MTIIKRFKNIVMMFVYRHERPWNNFINVLAWLVKIDNPYHFDTPIDDEDFPTGFCPHCRTMVDEYNVYTFLGYRCYHCTPIWWRWISQPKAMIHLKQRRKEISKDLSKYTMKILADYIKNTDSVSYRLPKCFACHHLRLKSFPLHLQDKMTFVCNNKKSQMYEKDVSSCAGCKRFLCMTPEEIAAYMLYAAGKNPSLSTSILLNAKANNSWISKRVKVIYNKYQDRKFKLIVKKMDEIEKKKMIKEY